MCFELDSLPPIPVDRGRRRSRTRTSCSRRRTATASRRSPPRPSEPGRTGIVVLPDVRGLYRFYEELALRFAERGHAAIAIDYFGRTGRRRQARRRLPVQGARRRDDAGGHPGRRPRRGRRGCARTAPTAIFTVGFCFGGRNSWLAAAAGHGLAGAVGFYGGPGERNGQPGPTQRADEIAAPILALQAGDDANITPELNAAFDAALSAAGVEHELVVYDGAPHSFFDRRYEEHAEASADAWRRVLEFVERHATARLVACRALYVDGIEDDQRAAGLERLVARTRRCSSASACRSSRPRPDPRRPAAAASRAAASCSAAA